MIRLLTLIINFFAVYSLLSAIPNFDIMPMNIHFLGSVSTSKNIIAYGNYGSYLISSDKGKSWKQRSMADFGEIRKIVNKNDTLWGIFAEGFVIKSNDHGITWSINKISINKQDTIIDLEVAGNSIYIRGLSSIYKYDNNFELQNVFSDPLLKAVKELYLPDKDPIYYYNYFIKYMDDKLIATAKKYDGFYIFSDNLDLVNKVSLKGKVYQYNPEVYTLLNILNISGKTVYNILGKLYTCDNKYEKWDYFFKDTNCENHTNANYNKTDYLYDSHDYFLYKNDLFLISSKETRNETNYEQISYAIGLKKYYSNPNDTFKIYNNIFQSHYRINCYNVLPSYFGGNVDGFRELLGITQRSIYKDSLIIWASRRKTLFMTNGGENWELVSNVYGKPKFIYNDSTYAFSLEEEKNFGVFMTTDGGVTFKPSQFNDSLYYNKIFTGYPYFFMDKNGKGFIASETIWGLKNNFAITNNFAKNFSIKTIDPIYLGLYASQHNSNILSKSDCYFISTGSIFGNKHFNYLFLLDTNFNYQGRIHLDSTHIIRHFFSSGNNLKYLATVYNKDDYSQKWLEVRESSDSCKTFTTIKKIDFSSDISQIYEHNDDSLFITATNPQRLLLYQSKKNTLDTLFFGSFKDSIRIFCNYDKFYLLCSGYILENSNRADFTKWKQMDWDYGKPYFYDVVFNDHIALISMKDSIRQLNYYKFTKKGLVNKVETQTETSPYFYSFPPYPNPSHSKINVKIYWDNSFDMSSADFSIYNSYGEKTETGKRISLNMESNYNGTLSWECSGTAEGVYFIRITSRGLSRVIPVVVGG